MSSEINYRLVRCPLRRSTSRYATTSPHGKRLRIKIGDTLIFILLISLNKLPLCVKNILNETCVRIWENKLAQKTKNKRNVLCKMDYFASAIKCPSILYFCAFIKLDIATQGRSPVLL